MKIRTYGRLTQLTFMSLLFPINAYIYEENGDLTVIDIGVKSFVPIIKKISQERQKSVARLLLTHAHADHTGALDRFRQIFPKAEILISERDARLLDGDLSVSATEKFPIKGGFAKLKTRQTAFLRAGQQIESLTILATAGHTPGHFSFYDRTEKVLIAGDALQTRGGLAVAGAGSWIFPFVNFGTWDKRQAIKSSEELSELNIYYLGTGHGKVLKHPNIKYAIEKAKRKE